MTTKGEPISNAQPGEHFTRRKYKLSLTTGTLVLLSLSAAACGGGHDQSAQSGAGSKANGYKAGTGAAGNGGGGAAVSGTAGDSAASMPNMMITCNEIAPTTPVVCGGQVCQAPAEVTNPCIIPCCVTQGAAEVCASKSTAIGFSTECAMPALPDPHCPAVNAPATPLAISMGIAGGTFTGCCNATQHKCGIISGVRPGCITESLLTTLPADPPACNEAADDGGTDVDAG